MGTRPRREDDQLELIRREMRERGSERRPNPGEWRLTAEQARAQREYHRDILWGSERFGKYMKD
jgi:hypothetical protein